MDTQLILQKRLAELEAQLKQKEEESQKREAELEAQLAEERKKKRRREPKKASRTG
jgi:hypothetical protein